MNPRNQKRKLHGFSLIELLVTLSIIAIVCAIIMNSYNGIQNSAIAVAQQKDQAELNQVLAELRISGGSITQITGTTAITTAMSYQTLSTMAGELTYLLQNGVTAISHTSKGTLGSASAIPVTEMIIPYPYDSTSSSADQNTQLPVKSRIVFGANGVPSIVATRGTQGFIAVDAKSSTDWTNFYAGNNKTKYNIGIGINSYLGLTTQNSAVNTNAAAAQSSSTSGTKYAGQQAYVWDEDPTSQTGPNGGGGGSSGPLYSVAYAYAFSPSGTYSTNGGVTKLPTGFNKADGSGSGTYNFADYTGITITSTQASGSTIYYPGSTGATVYIYAYLTNNSTGTAIKTGDAGASDASNITLSGFTATGDSVDGLPSQTKLACPGGLGAVALPAGISKDSFTGVDPTAPGVLYTVPICQYSGGVNTGILPQNWENGASSLSITAKASSSSGNIDTSTPPIPTVSANPMIHLDAPGFVIWDNDTNPPTLINNGDLTAVNNGSITIGDIAGGSAGTASDATYSTGNYTATGLDSGDGFTDGSNNSISYTNPDPVLP